MRLYLTYLCRKYVLRQNVMLLPKLGRIIWKDRPLGPQIPDVMAEIRRDRERG